MLRWMQDSVCVSAGLTLAWGLTTVGWAADTPAVRSAVKTKPRAIVTGRAVVDTPVRSGGSLSSIVPKLSPKHSRNVVRAQNNEVPNEFEEQPPTVVAPMNVIPPPLPPTNASPDSPTGEADTDALKRLKDRSAKARWEQIHQEWLRNRKSRGETPASPATSAAPADTPTEESGAPAASPANPFAGDTSAPAATGDDREQMRQEWLRNRKNRGEAQASPLAEQPGASANPFEGGAPQSDNAESAQPASDAPPANEVVPTEPASEPASPNAGPAGEGVTRPGVPANRVFLQSRQKPLERLPTDEELTRMLNDDNGERLPPPVRDPALMPKITDIIPSPKQRPETSRRPIPEEDAQRYVKLGDRVPYMPRAFPEFTYNFQASNVWSNPLYFEDPHLERYGHSYHPLLQTVSSTGLFALQLGGLPYQMAINHPSEKVYPLGWYLPGDYVPYRMRQIPLSLKATAVEAAVILGVGYATP